MNTIALDPTTLHHGFDAETTGLIDRDLDLMHPDQPRIVQLASVVADGSGNIIDEFSAIIKPDGWVIDEQGKAFGAHGITNERANAEGIPILQALARFDAHKKMCKVRFAHNLSYDKRMVAREYGLAGMPHSSEGIESFCTMFGSTNYCKLPGTRGYKWPKLEELHRKLFGVGFEGAHDALNDLRATTRCYFELRRLGVI